MAASDDQSGPLASHPVIRFGDCVYDREARELRRGGAAAQLTPKAFDLLGVLLEQRPRVVGKDELRDRLWPDSFVGDTSLAKLVTELRQAIGDDTREPRFVRTVHRHGYAFCGEALGEPERVERAGVDECSPYPGLRSFTEAEAAVFFGRDAEVEELWQKLRRQKLVAVIGPSGAGKSSFVRAGVLPARPEGWAVLVCTPGTAPLRMLGQALAPALAGDAEGLPQLLRFEDPETAVRLIGRWRRRHGRALLVVDQFEELFTLNPREVQAAFARLLDRLGQEADVHVLLSLRDDFLMRCHEHVALGPVFESLTPLGPLSGEALRRALEEPARTQGFRFEDEALVGEMLAAVEGERGALPLLAFAVARLWERRDRDERVLTRQAYEEIGGVAGALAQHAEATLRRLGPERQGMVREVFRNLVTAGGTRALADREALLSVFGDRETVEGVLGELVDARLLTSYEAGDVAGGARRQRVELVHESLLTTWPRLVHWQAQDAEGALLRDQLKQAAHLWEQRGRPEDQLWTDRSYRELSVWRERYPGGLTASEESFAQAARRLAGRQRRRRRVAAGAVLVAAIVVAAITGALWRRSEIARSNAEAEARIREAAQLVSLGRLHLEDHPSGALAYAIASLERADTAEARRFAVETLWHGPVARFIDARIGEVAFSGDGRGLAAAGGDGLLLLDRDGGSRRRITREGETAWFVGFDGSDRLITSDHDGRRVRVSSTAGGEPLRELALPDIVRWRGGRLLGVAAPQGKAGTAVLRGYGADGQPVPVLAWKMGPFSEMASEYLSDWDVDASATWLAVVEAGEVRVRRLDDRGARPRRLGRHDGEPFVQFEREGPRFTTSDDSGRVRVWNARTGQLERALENGRNARFSRVDPTGRFLAAGPAGPLTADGLVLRDLRAPPDAEPLPLRNKAYSWLNWIAFDPSGRWLATAHEVGAALWASDSVPVRVLSGERMTGLAVAFTPDGRHLISTSEDDTVRRWPLSPADGERVQTLWKHPASGFLGFYLAVDPRGRFALVLSRHRGRVLRIPLGGGEPRVHELSNSLWNPALDREGRRLAVSEGNIANARSRRVVVVDLETGVGHPLESDGPEQRCGAARELPVAPATVFLPDGRLLVDDLTGLWIRDLASGSNRRLRPCVNPNAVRALAVSTNGRTLVRLAGVEWPGEVSSLEVIDVETGTSRSVASHGTRLIAMALDASGTVLVTGDEEGLVRLGATDGAEPHLLYGHTARVTSLAVSPDGGCIASASDDGTIRLWPPPEGPPLHARPYPELIAKLKAFTNLRVMPDDGTSTGYRLEIGPFPGWANVPEW